MLPTASLIVQQRLTWTVLSSFPSIPAKVVRSKEFEGNLWSLGLKSSCWLLDYVGLPPDSRCNRGKWRVMTFAFFDRILNSLGRHSSLVALCSDGRSHPARYWALELAHFCWRKRFVNVILPPNFNAKTDLSSLPHLCYTILQCIWHNPYRSSRVFTHMHFQHLYHILTINDD